MGTNRRLFFMLSAVLLLTSEVAGSDLVARGNEPGWVVRKSADEITFSPMEGPVVRISPVPAAETVDGAEIYQSTFDGQPFRLAITDEVCVDTMSGMAYPVSVEVKIGASTLQGCGGDPESLLHGEWTVVEIDGQPIVAGSNVTLNFDSDGRLNGSASCNRYFSTFSLTGEGLTISNAGLSNMMCDQPLMDQEARFLELIAATTRFEIGEDGALVLRTDERALVVASREK